MKDVDMYGIPYQDHDPLLGLVVTIILIVIFYIGIGKMKSGLITQIVMSC